MASLRDLAAHLKELSERLPDNADMLTRSVARAVGSAVVQGTPVLTGRARVNWQCGLGTTVDTVLYPQPEKPSSPEGAMQEAIDKLRNIVAQYKGGVSIHITNNLPYIKRLNDGYSKQAPAGFVEAAVQAAHEATDRFGSVLTGVKVETI